MNIVKTIDQYNDECIIFSEPIKNNIMNEGTFIRIYYSTNTFILNGVFIYLNLNFTNIEKYYNKYKYYFDTKLNKTLVDKLLTIESSLLKKISVPNKKPQFKIEEQLTSGYIKFFDETINKNDNSFILKISGIWETEYNYGLTYKFTKI
jgi:hypothetical protein